MGVLEYPFVIGTAGHIDHGKTALVKALSGVDTDRLAEEKKRGMTIELGFAPLTLPSGRTISIIDVPGHEKFIRQMVAGAAGIDAAMLVIAADDGVMPQTREHLEILSLLDIKNGLVVLNKIDLVDAEMLAVVEDEVQDLLAGTFLEGKPLLKVSALTGAGVPDLTQAIETLVSECPRHDRGGPYFLPVDRAFHISGFGTVVTGTSVKGELKIGDEVDVLPDGKTAKVRSIQVHNEPAESACAGLRTAVNLAGLSLEEIERGSVVAAKGYYAPTSCLDVRIEVPALFDTPLQHWQRVRLHIGTSDVVARVSLLEGQKLAPGTAMMAQLLTEEPVATYGGARFILRSYSPLRTIAGGKILFPYGERPRHKAGKQLLLDSLGALDSAKDMKERIAAIVDYKGDITRAELVRYAESDSTELNAALASLAARERIVLVRAGEDHYLAKTTVGTMLAKITDLLEAYHKQHPELKGMENEEIARGMHIADARFLRELIRFFTAKGLLTCEQERTRLNGFTPFDESAFMAHVEEIRKLAKKCGYAMPTIEEAASLLNINEKDMKRAVAYLKEKKEATIAGGEFLIFDFLEKDLLQKLSALDGEITLAAVRDVTGSSRKYILPLLEYFDSIGITRRVADKRILRKKA